MSWMLENTFLQAMKQKQFDLCLIHFVRATLFDLFLCFCNNCTHMFNNTNSVLTAYLYDHYHFVIMKQREAWHPQEHEFVKFFINNWFLLSGENVLSFYLHLLKMNIMYSSPPFLLFSYSEVRTFRFQKKIRLNWKEISLNLKSHWPAAGSEPSMRAVVLPCSAQRVPGEGWMRWTGVGLI